MMTARAVALLAIIAGAATLIFVYGHKRGRRSCRNDYPDGWDAGQKAERDWWEHAAGITRDALARWQRPKDPGPERQWPYGFRVDPVLPATEVLLAEADAALGKPRIPSDAELDELKARFDAAQGRHTGWLPAAPVVADITDAARWRPFTDDAPTITGVIVGSPRDRTGPEWLDAQLAAMDSETAAYLRRVEADVASFRRGIGACS